MMDTCKNSWTALENIGPVASSEHAVIFIKRKTPAGIATANMEASDEAVQQDQTATGRQRPTNSYGRASSMTG